MNNYFKFRYIKVLQYSPLVATSVYYTTKQHLSFSFLNNATLFAFALI